MTNHPTAADDKLFGDGAAQAAECAKHTDHHDGQTAQPRKGEGLRVVPVEPTEEMIEAAARRVEIAFAGTKHICFRTFVGYAFDAMLQAAPAPASGGVIRSRSHLADVILGFMYDHPAKTPLSEVERALSYVEAIEEDRFAALSLPNGLGEPVAWRWKDWWPKDEPWEPSTGTTPTTAMTASVTARTVSGNPSTPYQHLPGREGAMSSLVHSREDALIPGGAYVASRASAADRPAMWRRLRSEGRPIISTWIDEAGEGETACNRELWQRIEREVKSAERLVFYAERDDFPLKGALVEVGMAIAAGVPVFVVAPGVPLEQKTLRPIGSWAMHPLVTYCKTVDEAFDRPPAALSGQGAGG